MNTKPKVSVLLIAGLAAGGMAAAQDQEKKIKRSDLPAAVEKTVVAESAGATIKGFSQEKENGQIFYEAEMTVNGHTKDVLIDANGAVVEVEEEVAVDTLPGSQNRASDQGRQGQDRHSRNHQEARQTCGVRSQSEHQREKV